MIGDLLSRIAKADDINSVDALTASVRNGTIPAFIGVPMIAELVKNQKEAQALGQGAPTSTVTDQVMQQAQALNQPQMPQQPMPEQMAMPQQPMSQQMPPQMAQQPPVQPGGISNAQSNLPVANMAGGGIVAFAGPQGSLVDDDEDNEEYYADMAAKERMAEMIANQQSESNALTQAMLDVQGNYVGPYSAAAAAPSAGILSNLKMPKSYTASKANKGSGIDSSATGASKGIKDDSFVGKIEHLESRGRDYDKYGNILTSPKGAMGRMQVMPNTSRDPGFGVKPAKDKSPEELARVGRDYAMALKQYYKGDEKLAAMAYNWGPGRVNDWLAGGKKGNVPGETRQYASNFAKGGEVKHFVLGDLVVDDFGRTVGADPRTTPEYDEFGRKTKETLRAEKPLSKEALSAQNTLEEQAKRRAAMAQPKTVKPAARPGISSLRGAGIATLAPAAIASIYEGLTGPDNAKIPTAADVNPGDLTKEEIELAKHPAFIMPKVRRTDPRPAFNLPIVQGEKPTPIVTPKIIKEEAKAPVDLSKIVSDPDLEDNLAPIPLPDTEGIKGGEKSETKSSPVQDALFELMQSQKRRAAKLEKQETMGNYMAALQGFLGMMGGTSPYLFTNVGQGASSGISSLLQSQKLQGANERALGRDEFNAAQMQRLMTKDEEDRTLRGDIAKARDYSDWTKMKENVEAKKAEWIQKAYDTKGINAMQLRDLRAKRLTGDLDEKGAKRLNAMEAEESRINSEASKLYKVPNYQGNLPPNISALVKQYTK